MADKAWQTDSNCKQLVRIEAEGGGGCGRDIVLAGRPGGPVGPVLNVLIQFKLFIIYFINYNCLPESH